MLALGIGVPAALLLGLLTYGLFRDEPEGGSEFVGSISVVKDGGSPWNLRRQGDDVLATLPAHDLAITVHGAPVAERFAGIGVVWRGKDFSTGYFGRESPLILPEHPRKGQERLTVRAAGDALHVRMEEGRVNDLKEEGGAFSSPGPLVLDARLRPVGPNLEVRLEGFYYIILPLEGTKLLAAAGPQSELRVEELASHTYLSTPRELRVVRDGRAEAILETNVLKLQVEVRDRKGYAGRPQGFELDFDHAFKDLGQLEIESTLLLLAQP